MGKRDGGRGWNPWQALREREHVRFARRDLPGDVEGVYCVRGDRAAILLDTDLDRRQRNAVLAHELVHDERGPVPQGNPNPPGWDVIVHREEQIVEREVARRLVPHGELIAFCSARAEILGAVTVHDVSEEFDVPADVAALALRRLT